MNFSTQNQTQENEALNESQVPDPERSTSPVTEHTQKVPPLNTSRASTSNSRHRRTSLRPSTTRSTYRRSRSETRSSTTSRQSTPRARTARSLSRTNRSIVARNFIDSDMQYVVTFFTSLHQIPVDLSAQL